MLWTSMYSNRLCAGWREVRLCSGNSWFEGFVFFFLGCNCKLLLFFQIDSLKKTVRKFFGDNPIESKVTARIVNKHQFKRLCNLLEEPQVRASIVHGGSVDEENLYFLYPYPCIYFPQQNKKGFIHFWQHFQVHWAHNLIRSSTKVSDNDGRDIWSTASNNYRENQL